MRIIDTEGNMYITFRNSNIVGRGDRLHILYDKHFSPTGELVTSIRNGDYYGISLRAEDIRQIEP